MSPATKTTPAAWARDGGQQTSNRAGGDLSSSLAPTSDTMAQHAAAYARAGLAVLALHTPVGDGCSCADPGCRSIGKHPRTKHGKDDATTDMRHIAAWWTCWPDANIGIRAPEGVVVLDVDPRAGGGTALAAVLAEVGGELPPTLTAFTGGGGLHAWFRCPGPYRGQLAPGVDLKGHAGYVVAPPSLHASGRRYAWLAEREITAAPAWLRRLIRRPESPRLAGVPARLAGGSNADDGLVRTVATAGEGGRNRALHWSACRAADRGAPAELLDRLRDAARSVGLDDREIERTIRSALNTGGAA